MYLLNWVCFGNASGYSQAAQDYIFALHNSGKYDVRVEFLFSLSIPRQGLSLDRYNIIKQLTEKEKTKDHIQVYHCIPNAQRQVRPQERNISLATFETFSPPNTGGNDWIGILNRSDAIAVPSQFNYKIFAHEDLKKPIFYVPHCYDTTIYHPEVEPLEKRDRFTFLFFGSWRYRKGYPQLIEAWCKEFTNKDNVQLVIKTDKTHVAEKAVKQIMHKHGFVKEETAPILFEKNIFDEVDLPRFLKSVDCLISPTLGEGFGLPGLQCMALEVPIIITDFSGCQEYANEQTATLLKPQGYVQHACLDNLPQFRNKKWAFITVAEIMRTMRYVLDNPDEIKSKAKHGAKFVAETFNYGKTEEAFTEMMGTLFNA